LYAQGKCRYSHDQKPFRPSPFFPARDFFDQFLSTAEDGFFFQFATESLTGGDANEWLRVFAVVSKQKYWELRPLFPVGTNELTNASCE
jgi:hypothetical protein